MAHTVGRAALRAPGRRLTGLAAALAGSRTSGSRHPLVATVMVLPFALLLAMLFGGVEAVITQASSVAGMLGR
ncbi:hypothetical protein [Streptomyces sp. JJ38]|uniref:hypothetical protein n=1 Tax=Streptomyces sp. JJ38 TaxID=2738128 RepID=UPI001C57C5DB|nr:hypothetical protein [Streptomyces sp. JJ38]MBW1596714.1 hypothetical protein [Streptomyces sp. JJ38]